MMTPEVRPLSLASCHAASRAPESDRELRCEACGNRMFSSRAIELLASGLRCSRCRGELAIVPWSPPDGLHHGDGVRG
jgi:hypothetical protein